MLHKFQHQGGEGEHLLHYSLRTTRAGHSVFCVCLQGVGGASTPQGQTIQLLGNKHPRRSFSFIPTDPLGLPERKRLHFEKIRSTQMCMATTV